FALRSSSTAIPVTRRHTPSDAVAYDRTLVAGLLARGSSSVATFPGGIPSGANDRRLAAYSCGGSRGIPCRITGTAFPIDPFREPPTSSVAPSQMGVNKAGSLDDCRWALNALPLRYCHIAAAASRRGRRMESFKTADRSKTGERESIQHAGCAQWA